MISFAENITTIVNEVVKINPKTILDYGAGFGKYGLLCKEAIMSNRAEKGDLLPKNDVDIDGLEMAEYFHDFENLPWLKSIYRWFFSDKSKLASFLGQKTYDLVLLIDVVEHWTKENAEMELISFFEGRNNLQAKNILISTPKNVHFYTEEYYGADCPKHISQWEDQDFKKLVKYLNENENGLSFELNDISTNESYIYVISQV